MAQKVVAHFIDHKIVKGTSMDVDPGKPICHIQSKEEGTVEVDLGLVKALYFVKDFSGQPDYDETPDPKDGDMRLRGSHHVHIQFRDGEELSGLMNRYPPNRQFFFVLPMDPSSNNIRILVNREAVTTMEQANNGPKNEAPTEPEPAQEPPSRTKRTSWVFDGKGIKYVDVDRKRPTG
jgi:hypothetical protein